MKIICCYSKEPHPKTLEAIALFAPQTEFVKTEGLFGYGEAIASRWQIDDLAVIEGDKEINAEVIPSFTECNEPWCTFSCQTLPEPYTKVTVNGLGCARFTIELQTITSPSEFICRDPDWLPCRHCNSQGCWNQLDIRMAMAFDRHGIHSPHVHGQVKHHHEYGLAWWAEWRKDWDYIMDVDARVKEIRERHA